MSFIRAANPIWWIPDLTGFPLNDEYYAFFQTNDVPYVPQAVYQDPNGFNAWPYPMEFQPSGTLPNNLYFDETKTYRIEIRHGNMSSDPLIWLIENFVPGNNVTPDDTSLLQSDNMITNPQFADINFVSPFTYTGSSTSIDIGPGWRLDLVGTGTVVLTQEVLPNPTVGNPNYALRIQTSGTWTSAKLVQRFSNNGAIFSSGAISVAFTARATGTQQHITVQYFPSGGTHTPDIYNTPDIALGAYNAYGNAINLDASDNPDTNGSAYVDIIFNLQAVGDIALTNIQIVGQTSPIPTNFPAPLFQQETYERTVDHEFNVYRNSLLRQPKENLLAGWTFGLNPWQFRSPTLSNVANNTYTADQTIIIQQAFVTSATANNVQVGRASHTQNYAFQIRAVTATNKTMMLQYIDPSTIRPYWGEKLSVMFRGSVTTINSTVPRFKVRLMYKSGLPGTIAQTVPVSVWSAADDSIPTISGDGWTYVTSVNDPTYTLTGTMQNFNFDGFVLPASNDANMTLGIAFIMMNPLSITGTPDVINIERISLVRNDFAIDAGVETFDETLRKCQFYYEKSYELNVIPVPAGPGPNTPHGANFTPAPITTVTTGAVFPADVHMQLSVRNFTLNYKTIKRISIIPTFFGVDGTAASITLMVIQGAADIVNSPIAIGNWTTLGTSTQNYSLRANTTTLSLDQTTNIAGVVGAYEGLIYYHYTADARLGI